MRRILAWSWLAILLTFSIGTVEAQVGGGVSLSGSDKGVKATASDLPAATPTPAPSATAAPAAPAAAAPASETAAAPASAEMDTGTYAVRLRDLEHGVNELKEQIFRSKARLSLLAETVLQGAVSGAQARIVHESKMGDTFKLVKITYSLDGAPILNKADEEGALGDRDLFDIYNGSIVPGEHTLNVQLEYRGNGYGIFSYLKGYRLKVGSSHTFTAAAGKVTALRVVAYEKGGPTAPIQERPAIRFVERVDSPEAAAEAVQGGE